MVHPNNLLKNLNKHAQVLAILKNNTAAVPNASKFIFLIASLQNITFATELNFLSHMVLEILRKTFVQRRPF